MVLIELGPYDPIAQGYFLIDASHIGAGTFDIETTALGLDRTAAAVYVLESLVDPLLAGDVDARSQYWR